MSQTQQQGLTGEGFAQGLGTGFLSIWQGIGANFNSTANYNNAVASQISANAAITDDALFAQVDAQKRQTRIIIIIFVAASILPIGMLLLFKSKKT